MDSEKLNELRELALRTAMGVHPNANSQNTQLGTGVNIKPTVEQILANADKIYEWLIKQK